MCGDLRGAVDGAEDPRGDELRLPERPLHRQDWLAATHDGSLGDGVHVAREPRAVELARQRGVDCADFTEIGGLLGLDAEPLERVHQGLDPRKDREGAVIGGEAAFERGAGRLHVRGVRGSDGVKRVETDRQGIDGQRGERGRHRPKVASCGARVDVLCCHAGIRTLA